MTGENPHTPRDAAQRILASLKATYAAPLEAVPALETDFGHLDLAAYAQFRAWAEGASLRYLGDLEFPALSNNPQTVVARAMVRTHLSVDGTIGVEYYQVRPRTDRVLKKLLTGLKNLRWIAAPAWTLRVMRTRHCVSLDTQFDDGSFVVTSNAEAAGLLSTPPSIDAKFFPYGTPKNYLLAAHRRRVQARLEREPARQALAVSDLAGVQAQHRRLSEQKSVYRAAQDWISKAEIAALTDNRELAAAVYTELRALIAASKSSSGQAE